VRAYRVLASVIFLNFTAGGATMPFFSLYATSLGASLGQIALVVGVQSAVALVGAQVLRGIAFAAYTATALTMAIDLAPPQERGRAAGLFTSAQGLAQISGSWLGGPLAAAFGFRALFELAAVAVLCGAAYSYLAVGRVRAAAGAPAAETVGDAVARTALARARSTARRDDEVKTS
jgi:MFS family permease